MLKGKWNKLKEKIKLAKLQNFYHKHFSDIDFYFALIILLFLVIFRRYFGIIWYLNRESINVAVPFLVFFIWLSYRDYRRKKFLNLGNLLSAFSIFLAALFYILQSTQANVTKNNLIVTANSYNCDTAKINISLSPSKGPVYGSFVIDPYINNSDMVFRLYGRDNGMKIMAAVSNMQGWNRMSNIIDGLIIQKADSGNASSTDQEIATLNSQQIFLASKFRELVCGLSIQQSWFDNLRSQISNFFKKH